jgi:hypothetical protein
MAREKLYALITVVDGKPEVKRVFYDYGDAIREAHMEAKFGAEMCEGFRQSIPDAKLKVVDVLVIEVPVLLSLSY